MSTEKQELISLLAEVFKNPNFETEYFNRIMQETYQYLSQAEVRDQALLDLYFYKNLYQDHPYSFANDFRLRQSSIHNINPARINEFYKKSIAPNQMVLTVVGDIDIDEATGLFEQYFADWKEREIELNQQEVEVNEENYNRIILVDKEDATQASMKLGYNFYDSQFEKRVPFMMGNRILGSGAFSSRLMEELRSERGYAYSINSRVNYSQQGGIYYINTQIEPSKSYKAIEAIKEEILAIKSREKEITEAELFTEVNLHNAVLAKSYEDKIDLMGELIYNVEFLDQNLNYINEQIREYNELKAEEVQKVISNHTYPDRFLAVIVARKEDVLPVFKEHDIDVEVVQ